MRTIVITGGTAGIGRALAAHYLRAGERVVVVGRSRAKYNALAAGHGDRARFIAADLSLVREVERVVAELAAAYDRIDALILCASYVRFTRAETIEGLEHQFALFYLGRRLLVEGLVDLLAASDRPVIVNVSVPGAPRDAIRWDDLQFTTGYKWRPVNLQLRRANELIGLTLPSSIAYVRYSPGLVRTSFAGDVGGLTRLATRILARMLGTPVEKGILPIVDLVDSPPAEQLTAFDRGRPVPVVVTDADREDARRLARETERIVAAVASAGRPH